MLFFFVVIVAFLVTIPEDLFGKIVKNAASIPVVLLGGIFAYAIPLFLIYLALKHLEGSKVSVIATFEVVMASFDGVIVNNEHLDVVNISGIVFVIAGLIFLQLNLK